MSGHTGFIMTVKLHFLFFQLKPFGINAFAVLTVITTI